MLSRDSAGNIVFTTPTNVVRVETRAPTTADGPSGGRAWVFGGHTFIYRGVEGTQHVWDVAGVWATAVMGRSGTIRSNGIYAPANYSGNGWARFTTAERSETGIYNYEMRDTGGIYNYIPTVTVNYSGIRGNPYDADLYGIRNAASGSFEVLTGSDHFNRNQDADHRVMVVRSGD